MTSIIDVKDDPKFTACLDHGFVGLIDHMGSDEAIARAARLSYGKGTRPVSEDRTLIRYLVRHKHTSPIEMAEVKLHLKLPIFVMRQLVRHRTASLNEYSGRYSVMSDEFYVPDFEQIKPQSTTNKQGRSGELTEIQKREVAEWMEAHNTDSYRLYRSLVGDPIDDDYGHGMDSDFPGIARELGRLILPVSNYTELYWKQDLHNLLHLIRLRRDSHAQFEIRVYAEAIYQAIRPLFPITCEAWEDYVWEAKTLSRMEVELLRKLAISWRSGNEPGSLIQYAEELGMGKREIKEFLTTWGFDLD